MNIPYGCVMVAVNESLKRAMRPAGDYDTQTFLLAGSGAGAVAAAATNPLDVVKTRLQTQALRAPAPVRSEGIVAPKPSSLGTGVVPGSKGEGAAVGGRGGVVLPQFLRASGAVAGGGGGGSGAAGQFGPVFGAGHSTGIHSAAARCATGRCRADKPVVTLQYQGLLDAVSNGQINGSLGAAACAEMWVRLSVASTDINFPSHPSPVIATCVSTNIFDSINMPDGQRLNAKWS